MSRMQKSYVRKEAFRDAKLLYIAVEGIYTEKIYFEQLAKKYRNPKTKLIIIPRKSTDSSPSHIMHNLIMQLTNYDDVIADNVYLVIDRDKWKHKMLTNVEKECFQKKYTFIVSNPCFELWLLLHKDDVSVYSREEKNKVKENKRNSRAKNAKKYLEKILSDRIGGYNKTSEVSIIKFIPTVKTAVANAEKLNPPLPSERGWPETLCTQVHIVAQKIIDPG
ncbi:MAG: RloB family protein [Fidelibacterota bacterium]